MEIRDLSKNKREPIIIRRTGNTEDSAINPNIIQDVTIIEIDDDGRFNRKRQEEMREAAAQKSKQFRQNKHNVTKNRKQKIEDFSILYDSVADFYDTPIEVKTIKRQDEETHLFQNDKDISEQKPQFAWENSENLHEEHANIENLAVANKNEADIEVTESMNIKAAKSMTIKIPESMTAKDFHKDSKDIEVSENLHINHRQHLKQQFLQNGLNGLTDVQKLELLLFFSIPRKDTNPIAHRLINTFGSLKDVFNANFNNLMEVNGVKQNSALLIKYVSELHQVINMPESIKIIGSASAAKEFCTKLFSGVNVEQFYVICLSKNNHVKKYKMIQSGSADEIMVQIRNITEFTLSERCNRIIISHNHPNGKGLMSDEDCAFTYSLICSCMLNSIEVIDHIIVGTDKAISLASQNILQKLKEAAFNSLTLPQNHQIMISNTTEKYTLDEE